MRAVIVSRSTSYQMLPIVLLADWPLSKFMGWRLRAKKFAVERSTQTNTMCLVPLNRALLFFNAIRVACYQIILTAN
jgi:hypothetical protein